MAIPMNQLWANILRYEKEFGVEATELRKLYFGRSELAQKADAIFRTQQRQAQEQRHEK